MSFSLPIRGKAAKAIRQTVRGWALQRRTNRSVYEVAQAYDPAIRGWVRKSRRLLNGESVAIRSSVPEFIPRRNFKLSPWKRVWLRQSGRSY